MWPDWVSNPGHLPLESDALPTALRVCVCVYVCVYEREREIERERKKGVTIQSCLRWEILLWKNDSHFSWGKNYYMYMEKLPCLSSD